MSAQPSRMAQIRPKPTHPTYSLHTHLAHSHTQHIHTITDICERATFPQIIKTYRHTQTHTHKHRDKLSHTHKHKLTHSLTHSLTHLLFLPLSFSLSLSQALSLWHTDNKLSLSYTLKHRYRSSSEKTYHKRLQCRLVDSSKSEIRLEILSSNV